MESLEFGGEFFGTKHSHHTRRPKYKKVSQAAGPRSAHPAIPCLHESCMRSGNLAPSATRRTALNADPSAPVS